MSQGLAANSRKTYSQAVSKYFNFCIKYNQDPFIIDELLILRFITYLSISKMAASSIRVYLAGVRAWAIASGLPPPFVYSQRIKWAIKALARVQAPPARVPPFTLKMIVRVHESIIFTYDRLVIYSAILLGYFGCLRAAEYLAPLAAGPPLTPMDIKFSDSPRPFMVLNIARSKTSVQGHKVVIGCSGVDVCAPCAIRLLIHISPHPHTAPLFTLSDGTPLSRQYFTTEMRNLLALAGISPAGITPHSLRAGSATDAAGLGMAESSIKSLGRWASAAYQVYIRPDHVAQARVAARLVSGPGHSNPPHSNPHSHQLLNPFSGRGVSHLV